MSDLAVDKVRAMFGLEVPFTDTISIRVPKVKEVALDTKFGKYSILFTISTRELFSQIKEVDELEKRYPTVWEMMFDEKDNGDVALGQLLGIQYPASALAMEGFEYWTGVNKEGFKKLSNGKIIHEEANWIIDKKVFLDFCDTIKVLTCYEPNSDYIAPKNMTPSRFNTWVKILKNRIKKAQRRKGSTFADKILILSISMDSYIPVKEIEEMSLYHFHRLYKSLGEKESYEKFWDMQMSQKFDTKNQKFGHWKDKINTI